jgi:flagellar assembly protein FliH
MRAKSQLAERNLQKMPWSKSKVVKRQNRKDKEIHRFVLEEVTRPPEVIQDTVSLDLASPAPLPPQPEMPAILSPYGEGYAKGFSEGEAKGATEGEAKGFAEGETNGFAEYAKGVAEGQAKGVAEGEAKGFAAGEAKGFAEGEAKGLAEGQAKGFAEGEVFGKAIREEELAAWNQSHELLSRLIEDLKAFTETIVLEAESDLLQITLGIARKIVKEEFQNPETVLLSIQEALKNIAPAKEAVIRIAPQAVSWLSQKSPEILEAVEKIDFIRIEADPKLQPGDCLIETEDRIVDARPETQLAEIKKKLLPNL